MGKRRMILGAFSALALASGLVVGTQPAQAASTIVDQWVYQPSPVPGNTVPDSVWIGQGSTLGAGVHRIQVRSTYAGTTDPLDGDDGADVERVQFLNGATPAQFDTQLGLATSGNPALAGPAMAWVKNNMRFFSGASVTMHMRYQIVEQAGTYYAGQVVYRRLSNGTVEPRFAATAKPYVVDANTTATLPATTQTLRMEPNHTFSVSTGGTIPVIHHTATSSLRVENGDTELHFAKFYPVSSSTTVAQAQSWCANPSGPSPVTGKPTVGIGTMSPGVAINVDASSLPAAGRYAVVDWLPSSVTGVSQGATMCKLVQVSNS